MTTTEQAITLPSNLVWVAPDLAVAIVPSVAPQEWAQYDKPCETCDGGKLKWALVGTPFRCPDCRDGRQVWEVRWPCEHPNPRTVPNGANAMQVCDVCRAHKFPFGQWDENDLSARATLQVVPVVEQGSDDMPQPYLIPAPLLIGKVWLIHDNQPDLIPLDPLPVPGRDFALVVRTARLDA